MSWLRTASACVTAFVLLFCTPGTCAWFSAALASSQRPFPSVRSVPQNRVMAASSGGAEEPIGDIQEEILQAENELKEAMMTSDIDKLDNLLSQYLVFTDHVGQVSGKKEDLQAHRSGISLIHSLDLIDVVVRTLPGSTVTAVVTAAAHVVGSYAGNPFDSTLRFTRVWQKERGATDKKSNWKVVAAHSSAVK